MQLKASKFAREAAGVIGLLYAACTLFVYLFPAFSAQLMGWLSHTQNLTERSVVFGEFIGGLVLALVYSYIAAWLFAWIFNRAARD